MIVITGGAGFIGSTLAESFKDKEIILIDKFSENNQIKNLEKIAKARLVNVENSKDILNEHKNKIEVIFHLGANSSTDQLILRDTIYENIYWSQIYWDFAIKNNIPFIYASSAATYGDGSKGFSDRIEIEELRSIKLNSLYAWSKMYFDLFVLDQAKNKKTPPIWFGLKFFNVYGVNEIHKGQQSSVLHPFVIQMNKNNKILLFKSNDKKYKDGEQKRDFISVNYCIKFIHSLLELKPENGIYNVGMGEAKTFVDFANEIMSAYGVQGEIEFINLPKQFAQHYQYFTQSENIKSKKIHDKINDFNHEDDLKFIVREINLLIP